MRVHACACVCMREHACACMHACMHVCVCVCVCVCVLLLLCVIVFVCVYTHTQEPHAEHGNDIYKITALAQGGSRLPLLPSTVLTY
jgi:hypothetical protein